jgi:hypothetical protein
LAIIENLDPKKPSFRPSKWPRKLKTAKNSKLPKLSENCFEPIGKGGWPPISTWITHSPKILKSIKGHFVIYFIIISNAGPLKPWHDHHISPAAQ